MVCHLLGNKIQPETNRDAKERMGEKEWYEGFDQTVVGPLRHWIS